MAVDIQNKLENLHYLLEEIKEQRQHYQDLRTENELLMHDNKAIKQAIDVNKLKLCIDYFKF